MQDVGAYTTQQRALLRALGAIVTTFDQRLGVCAALERQARTLPDCAERRLLRGRLRAAQQQAQAAACDLRNAAARVALLAGPILAGAGSDDRPTPHEERQAGRDAQTGD